MNVNKIKKDVQERQLVWKIRRGDLPTEQIPSIITLFELNTQEMNDGLSL